jgi:hypothetical protein
MSTWRDAASTEAQADLDRLLNAALGFAQQELTTRGEFYPFAAAIDTDGEAEMVAARPDPNDEHPSSADVVDACVAALVSQRDHIRAGAVVATIRTSDGDAVRIDLEHAEAHALTILVPYSKKRFKKTVEFGQLRAQAGQRRIWI